MEQSQSHSAPGAIDALAERLDRPVVLVGMMGVGKSSVGKRLANLLGFSFVDADDEIEESARMTIPEMFDEYGETYFRDGERRVIARLIEESGGKQIIATGGGAFCNPETRALILDKAVAVWLDADIDTLVERTSRKDNRPLLREGNPREILARLHAERKDAYACAQVHVRSGKGPHAETIDAIIRGLARWQ